MGELIQVVTQRTVRTRLMVSEDEWVESSGPGLVVHVGFVNSDQNTAIDETRLRKAVKSILNAKLASSSGWKTDHSDAQSLTSLMDVVGEDKVNVVIIPQATLAGKLVPGDKYLKYHRQVTKERGFDLFDAFIRTVVSAIVPGAESAIITACGGQVSGKSTCVTWGSFGKRQGFEMISTGPSTHYFEF